VTSFIFRTQCKYIYSPVDIQRLHNIHIVILTSMLPVALMLLVML